MEVIINENERSWVIDLISKINFILSSNDLIIKKAGGESTVSTQSTGQKKNMLFQQIYEDISKNLVPIRPDRHYTRTKGQLAGKYSNTHKRAY